MSAPSSIKVQLDESTQILSHKSSRLGVPSSTSKPMPLLEKVVVSREPHVKTDVVVQHKEAKLFFQASHKMTAPQKKIRVSLDVISKHMAVSGGYVSPIKRLVIDLESKGGGSDLRFGWF